MCVLFCCATNARMQVFVAHSWPFVCHQCRAVCSCEISPRSLCHRYCINGTMKGGCRGLGILCPVYKYMRQDLCPVFGACVWGGHSLHWCRLMAPNRPRPTCAKCEGMGGCAGRSSGGAIVDNLPIRANFENLYLRVRVHFPQDLRLRPLHQLCAVGEFLLLAPVVERVAEVVLPLPTALDTAAQGAHGAQQADCQADDDCGTSSADEDLQWRP